MNFKNFYIHIIGCQQNEHDGKRIEYLLEQLGFTQSTINEADFIIIVACSVRQTAVDRVFGLIRNNSSKNIIVTGCVLDYDKRRMAKKNVIFWDIEKPEQITDILKIKSSKEIVSIFKEGAVFSSCVPIMFGCNNFCSYCATAYTRGRERSRVFSDIVKDVESLVAKGEENILLLGQTIDSYKDPETGARLNDLFEKLNDINGKFMIGFTSNHPKDMTIEIIESVAKLPKIKKEIHLPIQSGSDKILKDMKRPYTSKQYLNIIEMIKKTEEKFNVKIDITTDVIIGFPSETDEDFQKTVEILDKVDFKNVYINKYSPRFGTAAFPLGDPVPWQEKVRRWRIINNITRRKNGF